MQNRETLYLAAATMLGVLAASAAASPPYAPPMREPITVEQHRDTLTRVVYVGDLALRTREGRAVLVRRVGAAVNEVCPSYDESGQVYDVQGCKEFAWTGARPQIRRVFDGAALGQDVSMSIAISAAPAH